MRFFCALFFSLIACHCVAQHRQKIYFLKNDGTYVATKAQADYIQVVQETEAWPKSYNVFEYYPDSSKRLIGKSSQIVPVRLEGQAMSYFHNGNKMKLATYKDNRPAGLVYDFYPSGKPYTIKDYGTPVTGEMSDYLINTCLDPTGKQLVTDGNGYYKGYDNAFKYIHESGKVKDGKRDSVWSGKEKHLKLSFTERYDNGKLISGESTDSAGNKHTYKQRIVLPQFKGGSPAAFSSFVKNHAIYPINASDNDFKGVVILSFVIPKEGGLTDIKILHGAGEIIDKEAMRVLKSSAANWSPGAAYGIPNSVYYTMPISFDLIRE